MLVLCKEAEVMEEIDECMIRRSIAWDVEKHDYDHLPDHDNMSSSMM